MSMERIDEILLLLLTTIKNTQYHSANHPLLKKELQKLLNIINSFVQAEGEFGLAVRNWYLYLNGERIRLSADNFVYVRRLLDLFKKIEIGGFTIKQPLQLEELFAVLFFLGKENIKKEEIEAKLDKKGLGEKVQIMPLTTKGEILDPKQRVKKVYFSTIGLVKSIARSKELKKFRTRLTVGVYYLIDTLKTSEQLLLGLTVVKNYDDYLYTHSVNVAILSLSMGVRLGLKTRELMILGQAALLHDIGKATLNKEIIRKASVLTPEEWDEVRKYPMRGAEILCELLGITEESAHTIITVLEHKRNFDRSGYPEFIVIRDRLSFFSRIIRITDYYDTVITPTNYRPVPMSSPEALSRIIRDAGRVFDPVLAKYFVNMVGMYPIGTLVFLNTGEWGLVIGNSKTALDKPIVRIIKDASGNEVKTYKTLDLSKSHKIIVKADSPWKYGVEPVKYFL